MNITLSSRPLRSHLRIWLSRLAVRQKIACGYVAILAIVILGVILGRAIEINPLLSLSEKLSIFRILEDRQGKRLRPFFRVVIPQSAKLTKMRSLHPGSLTIAWLQKLLIRGKTGE
jgi:hypothetical protein